MADTPADISVLELDALWDEFHRVVNMTSMELSAWLGALPEDTDRGCGEQVLGILHKRRSELTENDIEAMYEAVDTVTDGPPGDEDTRRRALMTVGHDPHKPS